MSFKFFPTTDDDPPSSTPKDEDPNKQLVTSKQVIVSELHYSVTAKLRLNSATAITELKNLSGLKLKCVNIPELVGIDGLVTDKSVTEVLGSTSDLKSGVYEGGFKTWECTYDLISYLQDNELDMLPERSSPLRILDLGCGSGLLGLSVLEMARRRNIDVRVDFQDYNSEVLDYVTIPNTLLNFNDEITATCRYFSGDWSSFKDLAGGEENASRYDLILSSETIYNLEYFPKLIAVVKQTLGEEQGACLYLAAKTFYFGVGGGTKTFLSMIGKDGELEGETVRLFKEGVKREIIRVRRKFAQ